METEIEVDVRKNILNKNPRNPRIHEDFWDLFSFELLKFYIVRFTFKRYFILHLRGNSFYTFAVLSMSELFSNRRITLFCSDGLRQFV